MLSIIVTWRDRLELGQALPGLLAAANSTDGDLTVVNFGGSRRLLQEQLGDREVSIVDVDDQPYFNKACAQNLGAAHTVQPFLFFCDCDIVLDGGTVAKLLDEVQHRPRHFGTLAGVRESKINSRRGRHVVCFGYELTIQTADGRRVHIVDHEEHAADGTRQAPGLLLVRRSDFLAIDGYNSRLQGWGWEDQDMVSRLTLGVGLSRLMSGHVVHLSHDDAARVGAYACKDRWESRDRMFRQALANYDAGDFQGTYRTDLKDVRVSARSSGP